MFKNNIFIRIVTIFMVSGISVMSYYLRKPPEIIPGLGPRVVNFQEERAVRWELLFQEQKIVCQKESNGSFTLVVPKPLRSINSSEFWANVKNLNTLEYLSIVQKDVEDLLYWGIDGKRFYRIFLENPQQVLEFQIGFFSKSFQGYYLHYGRNIYCVPEWIVKALEKTPQDLRQGYFLQKDVDQIAALQIKSKVGRSILIQKDGLFWKVNGVSKDLLEIANVDRLIQDISYVKSEKVFCPPDVEFSSLWKDLQKIEENSEIIVVICTDGTVVKFSLFIKDGKLYGVREDKKDIEVLPITLYESVMKPVEFYFKDEVIIKDSL